MPDSTKTCTKCSKILRLTEFNKKGRYKDGSQRYTSACGDCLRLHQKQMRENLNIVNPDAKIPKTKHCTNCGQDVPIIYFQKGTYVKKDGSPTFQSNCDPCKNKKRNEKRYSDPKYKAKVNAKNQKWQKNKYYTDKKWRENKLLKLRAARNSPEGKKKSHQQYINRKTNNPEGYQSQLENQKHKYHNDPEYRKTHRKRTDARAKTRLQTDEEFRTRTYIRNAFKRAFRYYAEHGKILSLKEYGIEDDELIRGLGSKPPGEYDIDHIIPVSLFNHDDVEQVRLCWSLENLQWLESNYNRNEKKDYISDKMGDYPEELHEHWKVAYKNYLEKKGDSNVKE